MSRIGKNPIAIPAGVEIKLAGSHMTVKGPKGTLELDLHPDMIINVEGETITVQRPSEERNHKALHGLTRTLIANMVTGVTTGFSKVLEIQGVGYRATAKGNDIELALGYSHSVPFAAPAGITLTVETPTKIVVSGADKQLVGQTAANIRKWREVEPYKGKGIRYEGEYVRRKAGKAAK
jgi:large subunit ribosomal protein L6